MSGVALGADALLPSFQQNGNTLVMSNGNVRVEYHLNAGNANFYWDNFLKISNFYSGVSLNTGYITGTSYSSWSYSVVSSNQVVVTGTGAGLPVMKQYFTLDQNDSFLVQMTVSGSNLQADWMGPVVVDGTGDVNIGITNDNRALVVPFDNDGFVRYNAMPMNNTAEGYEVAAFYDNTSRNGLVVGSVTHDTWKTGIYFEGVNNKLALLNVFGGATSPWDVDPHGYVGGNTVASPVVFVGFGPDWRVTMQNFAAENTNYVPRLPWTNGVPFGWNSWGVIQQYISYSDAIAVSDYFYVNLMNQNFEDNGTVYINLDAFWNNLSNHSSSKVLPVIAMPTVRKPASISDPLCGSVRSPIPPTRSFPAPRGITAMPCCATKTAILRRWMAAWPWIPRTPEHMTRSIITSTNTPTGDLIM